MKMWKRILALMLVLLFAMNSMGMADISVLASDAPAVATAEQAQEGLGPDGDSGQDGVTSDPATSDPAPAEPTDDDTSNSDDGTEAGGEPGSDIVVSEDDEVLPEQPEGAPQDSEDGGEGSGEKVDNIQSGDSAGVPADEGENGESAGDGEGEPETTPEIGELPEGEDQPAGDEPAEGEPGMDGPSIDDFGINQVAEDDYVTIYLYMQVTGTNAWRFILDYHNGSWLNGLFITVGKITIPRSAVENMPAAPSNVPWGDANAEDTFGVRSYVNDHKLVEGPRGIEYYEPNERLWNEPGFYKDSLDWSHAQLRKCRDADDYDGVGNCWHLNVTYEIKDTATVTVKYLDERGQSLQGTAKKGGETWEITKDYTTDPIKYNDKYGVSGQIPDTITTEDGTVYEWYKTDGPISGTIVGVDVTITARYKKVDNPLMIYIQGDTDTVTYDGDRQEVNGYKITDITVKGESIGTELPEGVTVELKKDRKTYAEGTDAGTYYMDELTADDFKVTQNRNGKQKYDVTVVYTKGWVEITKKPITVTITGKTDECTYDGKTHTAEGFAATVDGGGLPNGVTVTSKGNDTVSGTDADTYPMPLTADDFTVDGGTNYEVTDVVVNDGWLKINKSNDKITVTITGEEKTERFNNSSHTVSTYSYNVSGAAKGNADVTVTVTGNITVTKTGPGEYPQELKGQFSVTSKNYKDENITVEYKNGKLTINPVITVTVVNGTATPETGEVEVNLGEDQTFTFTADQNYALDSVTVDGEEQPLDSSDGVNYTHEFNDVTGNHNIVVKYDEDKCGGGADGTESDGIPDKYQVKVTYKVENGYWDEGEKDHADQVVYLTKFEGDKRSESGAATLGETIPEAGENPDTGYKHAGAWYLGTGEDAEKIEDLGKDHEVREETTFTFRYAVDQFKLTVTFANEDGGPIGYDPKTADVDYKASYLVVGEDSTMEGATITAPTKIVGWTLVEFKGGPASGEMDADGVTVIAVYAKDLDSNNVPDKDEERVTYAVKHGSWSDGDYKSETLTFGKRLEDGTWQSSDTAQLQHVPETNDTTITPNKGYKVEGGSWNPSAQNGDRVKRTGEEHTYIYECAEDPEQTKTLHYYVQYYKDDVAEGEHEEFTESVWVNAPDTLTVQEGSVNTTDKYTDGWTFEKVEPCPVPETVKNGDTIHVYYTADTDKDGKPDKYEATVTYKIENGTWSDGSTADRTEDVVFAEKDGYGNWVEKNAVALHAPEGMQPNEGYTDGAWKPDEPVSVTRDGNKEFTYTFEKDSFGYTVRYHYRGVNNEDMGTEEVQSKENLPFEAEIPFDANPREYDGKHYVFESVEPEDPTIGADRSKNVVDVFYTLDEIGTGEGGGHDNIPDKYQVTIKYVAEPPAGGTVSKTKEVLTIKDGKVTANATATKNNNYVFDGWTNAAGENVGTEEELSQTFDAKGGETYTFTAKFAVDSDNDGTADDKETNDITVEVENGTADPADSPIKVNFGQDQTITFQANQNYALDSVTVDGKAQELSVLADGSYTFVNVTENHSIKVVYAADDGDGIPDKYQVTVTYKVVNGTWDDGGAEDQTERVTLTKDGKWSGEGSGHLESIPENMKPAIGHDAATGTWGESDPQTAEITKDGPFEFTYTFAKGKYPVTVQYVDQAGNEIKTETSEPVEFKADYNVTVPNKDQIIDVNTKSYRVDSVEGETSGTMDTEGKTITVKCFLQVSVTYELKAPEGATATAPEGATLDVNGTHEVSSDTYDQVTVEHSDGSKTRYTFEGWMLDGEKVSGKIEVTEDITLTGSWSHEDSKSVSYETGNPSDVFPVMPSEFKWPAGGAYFQGEEYTIAEHVGEIVEGYKVEEREKLGTDMYVYTFHGWFTDPECTQKVEDIGAARTMGGEDVTYYGYWTKALKEYTVTVKYVDEDTNIELQEAVSVTTVNDQYDVGEQVVVPSIVKDGVTYLPVRVEGEVSGTTKEDITVTVYYAADKDGNGIPDDYQTFVTFHVENGTWDGDKTGDFQVAVALKDESGAYDRDAMVKLEQSDIPTGMQPAKGYDAATGAWDKDPGTTEFGVNGPEFTFKYTEASFTITVKYVDEDGNAIQDATVTTHEFESAYSVDIDEEITTASGDHYIKVSVTDEETLSAEKMPATDLTFTAKYTLDNMGTSEEREKGDGVADKYQVTIKYAHGENGTVEQTEEVITLQDESGKYLTEGDVTATANAIADGGYHFDSWTADNGIEIDAEKNAEGLDFTFHAEGGKTYTFTASFGRDIPGPSIDPVVPGPDGPDPDPDNPDNPDPENPDPENPDPDDPDDPPAPPAPVDPNQPGGPDDPDTPDDPGDGDEPDGPNDPADGGEAGEPEGEADIDDNAVPLANLPQTAEKPGYEVKEEADIAENDTPLGLLDDIQNCCILHFLIMLCALAVTVYYTHDRKRRQEREFEVRSELSR